MNNLACATPPVCLTAGCDVSADSLDVACWRTEGIEHARFPNTPAGHAALIRWLVEPGFPVRVVLEASGIYGLDLSLALHQADHVAVMVLNPRAAKDYRRKGLPPRSHASIKDRPDRCGRAMRLCSAHALFALAAA